MRPLTPDELHCYGIKQIPSEPDWGITAHGVVYRITPTTRRYQNRPLPWPRKLRKNRKGYLHASFKHLVDGVWRTKHRLIHHLVLEAFVGPKPADLVGAHNDGNIENNRVENLRWTTQADNLADKLAHGTDNRGQKHWSALLSDGDVHWIRAYPRFRGACMEMARKLQVDPGVIRAARGGLTWAHLPATVV